MKIHTVDRLSKEDRKTLENFLHIGEEILKKYGDSIPDNGHLTLLVWHNHISATIYADNSNINGWIIPGSDE